MNNQEQRSLLNEEVEVIEEIYREKGWWNVSFEKDYFPVPARNKTEAKENAIEILIEDEVLKDEKAIPIGEEMKNKQKEQLKYFKKKHPAECCFIELMGACGAYDKKLENKK